MSEENILLTEQLELDFREHINNKGLIKFLSHVNKLAQDAIIDAKCPYRTIGIHLRYARVSTFCQHSR